MNRSITILISVFSLVAGVVIGSTVAMLYTAHSRTVCVRALNDADQLFGLSSRYTNAANPPYTGIQDLTRIHSQFDVVNDRWVKDQAACRKPSNA